MSSSGEPSETRQRLDRIRRRSTSSDRSAPAQNGKKGKAAEESTQNNGKNNEDGCRPNEDPIASGRSCKECRRLKRKCDRQLPCSVCTRFGKKCAYAAEPLRKNQEYIMELERKVGYLQHLLETSHSSQGGGPPPARPDQGLNVGSPTSQSQSLHSEEHVVSMRQPPLLPSQYQPSPAPTRVPMRPSLLAGQTNLSPARTPETRSFTPSHVPSYELPTPPGGGASTSSAVSAMRPGSMPITHNAARPLINEAENPNISSSNAVGPSHSMGAIPVDFKYDLPPASEVLERQPSSVSGYEWNERWATKGLGGNDGYASLSIEPDGQGYLGFASGSTLLRILQLCAGSVSLASLESNLSAAPPPPRPQGWTPTMSETVSCVDAYFEHYHPQYPLLHEPTFRAQWNDLVPQPLASEWDFLLNIVLAIGAFCVSRPTYVIDYFLEAAISQLSVEYLEKGSLTLVQAFCLLSNISQKRNKPNSGSVYMGIALRLAIGLGLHRELPFWNISPFDREVRRRTWWVVVSFDSGSTITFGRPILEPHYPAESDVYMVHNVHDRAFTPAARLPPVEVNEPTIYTALINQASFHASTNRIYTRVMSSPAPSATETLALDSDLLGWYATVPEHLHPQNEPVSPHWLDFAQYKMFWRYCNLRIILHRRAFLERALKALPLWVTDEDIEGDDNTVAEIKCTRLCQYNASDTIHSMSRFFSMRQRMSRLESWYGLHFLFHASFIPLIALHVDPNSPRRPVWEEEVSLARKILVSLKDDPLVERCLLIIDALVPHTSSTPIGPGQMGFQDTSTMLYEMLQSNPTWQNSLDVPDDDLAPNLLPVADLATLSSLWPDRSS
ncbi:nuclear protein [Cryptococcus neoformans C23]|uniref:Nuclear protein n=2 Tax=Cryptococcus neoformans TaxID=5207 RepID=A0A854QHH8_CRYNE|nr:nuclear protein [Cryptococcus neoformans var. grubii H99]AUB28247.1 nuclear protein [Cryptococcus neoformans var. grubii]OWZ30377.1 nuclear protein [Cryptococcus neoformans var. grubii AD1-83a]OWZ33817.1 nuclear protein [Cryptococcus neoformans var. grubii AD2-60a]OWZ45945.1 nuclear protein [Cryptococcus neoformans var. grubii C23]OXC81729.1 nuclear protein [Cryptococcus neoformans var. grubii AD1-7a]OXG25002.1 nuclear protein [Cryptococcus neoformans var. grubii Tu259-1]OXG36920.1 nuclea|eukprot:XP_012052510.1 nuclear protein [Cryptococcus neoformans var. grubii H99]